MRAPHPNAARFVRSAALVGVTVGVHALGASVVRASQEFPANSTASISATCEVTGGGKVVVQYANPGGEDNAHFSTSVDGKLIDQRDVVANATSSLTWPLPDDVAATVVVEASDQADPTAVVGPLNCFEGSATFRVDCRAGGGGPALTGVLTNVGQSMNSVTVTMAGQAASTFTLAPGQAHTLIAPVGAGADVMASAVWAHPGAASDVSVALAVPDCDPPDTEVTSTIGITETSGTQPAGTQPTASQPDVSRPVPVLTTRTPAPLPETGTSSDVVLAAGAVALTGVGATLVSRRRRRSPIGG